MHKKELYLPNLPARRLAPLAERYRKYRRQYPGLPAAELLRWCRADERENNYRRQVYRLIDAGLLRFYAVPDDCCGLDDLMGDMFNPSACPDIPEARLAEEKQAFIDRIERDGVWGLVCEYRTEPDEPDDFGWDHGDSIFRLIGDDMEHVVNDLASEATAKLVEALRARCPHCRK